MFFLFDPVLQDLSTRAFFLFSHHRIYDKAYNRQATLYPDDGNRSIWPVSRPRLVY